MKRIINTFLIGMICVMPAFGQTADLILSTPETGTQVHQATNSITFASGYSYTPAGGTMLAEIIRQAVNGNISYFSPVIPGTYDINTQLAVGKIQGNLIVNGSANYSIPISIPSGTAGLQPSISFNYTSGFSDGLVGIGWNIGGISAITRTNETIYNDNKSDAIRGDLTDKYALDGKRLVTITGSYGADGSVYGTELEEFSKVISKGSSGTNQGPEYFIVYTKSGLTCEYGNSADSKLKNGTCILTWKLNKIKDKYNNYIKFSYITTDDELPIDKIEYTGNGTIQDPFAQIFFNYKSRSDISSYVYGGKEFTRDILLENIEVKNNGQLFKKYKLDYMRDTYAQLQKVTEYSSQDVAVNPAVFTWTDQTETFTEPANYSSGIDELLYIGDFNGDGRDDLVAVPNKTSYTTSDKWKLYLADASGNLNTDTVQGDLNIYFESFMVNDFNGDGLTDLMMQEKHPDPTYPNRKYFYFYQSTGTNFTRYTSSFYTYTAGIAGARPLLGVVDYNGDRKLEFLTYTMSGSWNLRDYLGAPVPNCSGTIPSFGEFYCKDNGMQTRMLDFNGDGCSDILTLSPTGYIVYEFKGTNNVLIQTPGCTGNNMINQDFLLFGDFNGDGSTDIIRDINPNRGSGWDLMLLTSGGFQAHTLSNFSDFNINVTNNRVYARDMDADGKTDVVFVGRGINTANNYDRINVALSTGNSFNFNPEYTTTNPMQNAEERYFNFGDYDGDGRYQLLYKCYGTLNLFSFASGTPSHLVNNIIDGFGAKTTLTYLPMSNSNVYTRGTGASYPVSDFSSSMQLVSQVAADNGIGGTSSVTYKYEGAKIHLQGRGFLGFAKQITTDVTAGLLSETVSGYNTTYFYPQVNSVTKKTTGGATIETTTNAWTPLVLDATNKRIFPYVLLSTLTNLLTGHSVKDSVTSVDVYGNPGRLDKKYNNGVTETTVNNYTTWLNTTDWLVGRIGSSTVTYSKSGETSVSRAVRYTYSTDGIVKPDLIYYYEGSPLEYYQNHNYDNKGNLTQIYTYGSSVGASQVSYTYDANGIKPLTVTDALGHTTTYIPDINYDRYLSAKDYLGNYTIYQYDPADRLYTVLNPEGKQVTTTYFWTGLNKPALAVYGVTQTGNDGSMVTSWYDRLGRVIRTIKKGFNGSSILTDTEYNPKGQLFRVSEPYIGGNVVWAETYTTYDDYGRISVITRNTGRNTTYLYPGATISETTAGKTFSKTYGPDGTLTSATDNGGTINYAYFPDGKVKTITAPGDVVTSMQYADAARNQTQLDDPSAETINYTYDSFGRVKTQTNAGQTTTVTYLADGRTDNVVKPEGTTTYSYNANKQLTGVSSTNSVSRTYGYDTKGRITSISETIAGSGFSTNFTYDSYGRLSTRTHPSGIVETLGYNSSGYLSTVSAGGSTRFTVTGMNARQQLTGATYGTNLTATYGFDAYGYPSSTVTGSVQNYGYSFNPATGNLYWRKNVNWSNITENFSYTDNGETLDRLTKVTGPQNLDMTYAANGNILTKSDISSSTAFTYGANAGPYAITGVSSSTGVIPVTGQTATYTSFEKVNTLNEGTYTATFVYNSDNQRAKMDVAQSGTNILTRWYAGSRYMKETAGVVTKEITWIGGDAYTAPVVAETANGTTTYYYLLRDYLGNITHQVNTSNSVVAEYSYDAWGRRRNPTNWSYDLTSQPALFADRGFTGHEHLTMFNLINMNGRLYDPLVGRFLSPDNYVQAPGYTQSFNRYTYALNNPLIYTDPDGEFAWLAAGIFAAFTYFKTAYDNRNPETGKWAWNPKSWFGKDKNTTVIVGINTNTSFSNVTGFTGIGVGPYMPAVAVNSNKGVGFGVYTPQGTDFAYPGVKQRPDYNIVINAINKARDYNNLYASTVEKLAGKPYLLRANGPDAFDCSSTACYGIRTIANSEFGDYNAHDLYKKFSVPSNSKTRGSVVFYDYTSDGRIDHITTILNSLDMLHPSSGAGVLQIKPINYLDSYTNDRGGTIYYQEFNWQLIINKTR